MTHANTYPLEDGWAAVRLMLAQIAARFGALAPGPLPRDVYEELLHWLRAAEHLARLMLYIIARTLTPVVRVVRTCVARAKAARRVTVRSSFRFALRVARVRRRVRRARIAGIYLWRRRRAPLRDDGDGWPAGVFEEVRAPLRQPPPLPVPLPATPMLDMPSAPITARLAALARVLADPYATARRIGARVHALDACATQRLLDARRIFTRTPCADALLHIHDRAFSLPAPDSS